MDQLPPPAHDVVAVVPGPWWTVHEPSLRVPRPGGAPAAVWTAGAGPDVLLVPPAGDDHDVWAPLSAWLGEHVTVHAMDRSRASPGDGADHVAVAADAVGAASLVGFAGDAALLSAAARRTMSVHRVVVLTPPGAAPPTVDGVRVVAVSAAAAPALTAADARRLIENLGKGPRP